MSDAILNALSVLFWIPTLLVRLVLIVIGFVAVPITSRRHPIWGNNEHPFPPTWFMKGKRPGWRDYVWRAWRNPANNVRYLLTEPLYPNVYGPDKMTPDHVTRVQRKRSSWQFVRSGLFSEFWYQRRIDRPGKLPQFFEFRIGWKFGGIEGFGPTLQLRKGA